MFGVLTGLYLALFYMVETTEHRALKAGYSHGAAQRVRVERRAEQRISQAERYGLNWAPRPPQETHVHDDDTPHAPLAPLVRGPDLLPLRRPGGPDAAAPGGRRRVSTRCRSRRSPARTSRYGLGDRARERVRPGGHPRLHIVVTTLDRFVPCLSTGSVDPRLLTDRLVLRAWQVEDAAEALGIYGHPEVARWLSAESDQVPDVAAMRLLLQHWIAEDVRSGAPAGRWAIERRDDGRLLGGAILLRLPPRAARTSNSAGNCTRRCGDAATPARPPGCWRTGRSATTSPRSSRSSGRATPVPRRRCGATAWNGSGRPANTSGSTCRCSVCATPTSTPPHRSPRYPRTPPPGDRSDPATASHGRTSVGLPSRSGGRGGICRQIQARHGGYRCGMALGKNKRTSPRGAWGDVRTAQVIGLPGVHNAPCRSVSASTRENRVLTQARGAEPYRGMLRVGARCCSCWEPRPGGRIFSADPTLACRRSLPRGLLRNPDRHKGAGTCHPSPAPGG
jgi:hypothetical protein